MLQFKLLPQKFAWTLFLLLPVVITDFLFFSKNLDRIDRIEAFEGRSDFIAVLTGGKGRLRDAFLLFSRGHAPSLLISGIEEGLSLESLFEANPDWEVQLSPELKSQIVLDRISKSTRENADAVVKFCQQKKCKSLILVTSSYHRPRSERLLLRALKRESLENVEIFSFGVESPNFPAEHWWLSVTGLEIALSEYFKYRLE